MNERKKQKKPTRKKKTKTKRRKRKRKKGRTRANDKHSKTQKRRKKFDKQKSRHTDKDIGIDDEPKASIKETQKSGNQTEHEYETDDEQRSDLLGLGYDEEPSEFEDLGETKPKHSTADYHEEEAAIGLLEKLLETERQARNIMGSQEDTTFDTAQVGNEKLNIKEDTTAKPPKKKKKKKKPKKKRNKTTKTTSKKKSTKKSSNCRWFKRKRLEVKKSYQNFKRQNCLNRRLKAATSYDTLMLLYKQLFDITKSSNIVAEHIGDYKTFISSVKKFLEVNPICFTNLQWNHVLIKVCLLALSQPFSLSDTLFFRFGWTTSRNFVLMTSNQNA